VCTAVVCTDNERSGADDVSRCRIGTPGFLQLGGDDAAQRVRGAACRVGHDEADQLARVGVASLGEGQRAGAEAEHGQGCGESASRHREWFVHGVCLRLYAITDASVGGAARATNGQRRSMHWQKVTTARQHA